MKLTRTIALSLILPLAACARPITPSHEVFHLQEDYKAAAATEKLYGSLPDCTTPEPTCSLADARAHLLDLDKKAAAALIVARAGAATKGYPQADLDADLTAARLSVAAFGRAADLVAK
jgi:hypothetical protein